MVLLEIAAQGVRGFAPERGRIALRPGYNVIAADGAALRRLVLALLHPEQPPDPALRPDASGGAVRGGVTLTGDDGVTWRVVRDMGGPCQLQRFDPEKQAFRSVQQDPARIAEVLRAAGAPSVERLEFVLGISAADFPSRHAPGASPFAAAAQAAAPRRISSGPADARRRLEAARAELAQARDAEVLQGKMDALQARLFKLEEMLKSGEQVNERLRVARERVASFAGSESALDALGDAASRLAVASRATARRDEALSRIAAEREEQGDAPSNRWPLQRTPGFLAGAGVGVAALLAGLVTEAHGLALVAIPATGWAAFEGLRWVGRAEEAEQAGRRARVLAERERKTAGAWERETADVRAAMKAVGVANLGELEDLLARFHEARAALAEAEAGHAAWQSLGETQDAEAERATVQQEIGAVEAQLTGGGGGFVRDVASLEQEIARLEREMETGPFEPMAEALEAPAPQAPVRGEPLRTLLERATADLGLTPGGALRAIQQRVLQLLPALSGQRLSNFFVDERGNLQVQSAGKLVPLASLGTAERDVCYAVLKVAFLEQGLAAGRSVGVIDDAFAGLHEGSRRVVARVLKQLARGRQVVHGTSDVLFREAADHAA